MQSEMESTYYAFDLKVACHSSFLMMFHINWKSLIVIEKFFLPLFEIAFVKNQTFVSREDSDIWILMFNALIHNNYFGKMNVDVDHASKQITFIYMDENNNKILFFNPENENRIGQEKIHIKWMFLRKSSNQRNTIQI